MAPLTKSLATLLLLTLTLQPVLSAPIVNRRQLAGEGSAADSILSDTDNGIGYGTENAEDNTASLITSAKGYNAKQRRQLAGEGSAADSILSDTDNGIGYGTENAEDNTASLITSAKGTNARRQLAGEGSAADSILSDTDNGIGYGIENAEDNTAGLITSAKGSAPAAPAVRRQADKISNGAAAVLNAAGAPAAANAVQTNGDSVDGTLTGDAANAGAQVGSTEQSTLEGAGAAVPKRLARRQGNKIADGTAAVLNAAGQPGLAGQEDATGNAVDSQGTNDAANAGAQVGGDEETTLEDTGSDVPSSVPQVSTKKMFKRQGNKIADGTAAVLNAAGQPGVASQEDATGNAVDSQGTNDAANTGAQVGGDEETVLENTGSDVPSSVPQVNTKH